MAILYAPLFGVFMFLCMMSVREQEAYSASEPLKLVQAFRETLRNKKFWVFNISNSFAQTVNGLISSTIPFTQNMCSISRIIKYLFCWRRVCIGHSAGIRLVLDDPPDGRR